MHATTIRWAQSLGILSDGTPWRSRLRSILSDRRPAEDQEPRQDSPCRLDDPLLARVGLRRELRISRNKTNQQPGPPVPVALLAMWMPPIWPNRH